MDEPPRDLKQHILNREAIWDVIHAGTLMGLLAFANYLLFYWRRGLAASHIDTSSQLHMSGFVGPWK